MITVSLNEVIQGKVKSNESCLYLVRSNDAVLLVNSSIIKTSATGLLLDYKKQLLEKLLLQASNTSENRFDK